MFTKSQLVASETYKKYRDLLNATLEKDKTYTKEEVDKIINDYLTKAV